MINPAPEVASETAELLLTGVSMDVFDPRSTQALLRAAFVRRPDVVAPHLVGALAGPEAVAVRAGALWATAFVNDLLHDPLARDLSELCPAARRGAAKAFAGAPEVPPTSSCACSTTPTLMWGRRPPSHSVGSTR